MSLLEDVFLEDEAGEAQELERVIEGDELDDRPRTPDSNENSEKEDEAEEDKRVVDHTAKAKRAVKNPRFVLNPARLTGPRGIQIIPEHFKDFKFKGKGHEREDLDCVLKKLEHWAYRLYPKFKFDDCLKKIETLGKKRPVMVHLHKIRTDQFVSEETVQQQDSSEDETAPAPPEDEFDRLLQQQIELARSTPAPNSAKKEMQTPMSSHRLSMIPPKASSSPSISDEQKERMMRNRKLAEERRVARLNQANGTTTLGGISTEREEGNIERVEAHDAIVTNDDVDTDVPVVRKLNRTNVIDSDSSDDETDVVAVNESVTVDVHNTVQKDIENINDVQVHSDIQKDVENANDVYVQKDVENADDVHVQKEHANADDFRVQEGVENADDHLKTDVEQAKGSDDKENTALEAVEDENMVSSNVPNNINKSSENEKEVATEDASKETEIKENNIASLKRSESNSNSDKIGSESSNSIVKEKAYVPSEIADQNKEVNKDSNSVTEELMDVDFTDDF